jgi:hypothetical protein
MTKTRVPRRIPYLKVAKGRTDLHKEVLLAINSSSRVGEGKFIHVIWHCGVKPHGGVEV